METNQKNTFISQNTIFGLFVGLSFILASFTFYKSGKSISLNPQLNNVMMLLSIAGTFIGVRKYREESLNGSISYGNALGACVYLITVASLLYGIYIYWLYRHTPELQENYISTINSVLEEVYKGTPLLENMKAMLQNLMTAGFIAFSEIFNKIFTGFIFSLLLAGILRKRKN